MLHRLCGSQQARIQRWRILEFLHNFLAFVEDALVRVTLLAAGGLVHQFEDLLEPLNLIFGLVMVFLEGLTQLVGLGRLGHLRQSFIYLLFGVVDVFESVQE